MSTHATVYNVSTALQSEAAHIAFRPADEKAPLAEYHTRIVLGVALALARTVPDFDAAGFVQSCLAPLK